MVGLHRFNQGVHGAKSVKPTMFLTIKLPSIRRYLCSMQRGYTRLYDQYDGAPLIGFDKTNKVFRTNAVKGYPPSLCRAIANAITDSFDRFSGEANHIEDQRSYEEEMLELKNTFYMQDDR